MTKLLSDDLYTICTTKIFSQTTLNVIGSTHEIDKLYVYLSTLTFQLEKFCAAFALA
jgi:hypothetical protein